MKRKIAAILAADVVGYSKLVAEDEEETLRRLASYRSVVDDFIAKANGRIFNTAGDAVLAEFSSAVEAVRCAIDIQESLRTRNMAYPPSRQMSFRMGITIGDVVERDGDLLGDGVNIAARLRGSRLRAASAFHARCTSRWRTSCRCSSPISVRRRSRTSPIRCTLTWWACARRM
jgi:class 3 adenylate cyclase